MSDPFCANTYVKSSSPYMRLLSFTPFSLPLPLSTPSSGRAEVPPPSATPTLSNLSLPLNKRGLYACRDWPSPRPSLRGFIPSSPGSFPFVFLFLFPSSGWAELSLPLAVTHQQTSLSLSPPKSSRLPHPLCHFSPPPLMPPWPTLRGSIQHGLPPRGVGVDIL